MRTAAHRFINALEINTYRPIINESDIHHSLKDTIFDAIFLVLASHVGNEVVVELLALLRRRGSMEIWLIAFLC